MRNPLIYPMLALLWLYKYTVSPMLTYFGVRCRHTPSCSDYSKFAIQKHCHDVIGLARLGLITCLKPLKLRRSGRLGDMAFGAELTRIKDNGHFDIS